MIRFLTFSDLTQLLNVSKNRDKVSLSVNENARFCIRMAYTVIPTPARGPSAEVFGD